ncbi:MAG TPA: hypothetical protein VLT32_12815 [Candidatus Sulfomarinibacteraceae bacterium]|nr:hypothetical protein [Candidatus Sulfomarinibacteraceae bacterium]
MTGSRRGPIDATAPGGLHELRVVRALKLVGGGVALAHADGETWMVRGGLPGELLRARPTRRRARVVEAVAEAVVADPHPARLADPCPHAPACGGCDWPHVDPEAGAALKAGVAAEAAARGSRLAERLRAAPVTASPPAYRLRSRLHWDPAAGRLGFFGHRSREVAPISGCRVITPSLALRLEALTSALAGSCPAPMDVEWLEGHDAVVAGLRPPPGGTKPPEATWLPPPSEALGLDGWHCLDATGTVLAGWGRDHVHIDLPIRLEVPIGSFFQGNRHLAPWLFDRLASLIGPGDEPLYDLHAGVGLIAAAGRHAGRHELSLVEPQPASADAARRNLPGARVVTATAEDLVADEASLPPSAVVATDPPRTGMSPFLRDRLAAWRPRRLVMLGCDPATWSRDAAFLLERGFSLEHLELVDLFPSTHHVEVLAVLEAR